MFRYLPGIILVQLATGALAYALVRMPLETDLLLAVAGLATILTLVVAFWFSSIAAHARREGEQAIRESYARETQDLRVDVERQKAKIIRESHKQLLKETRRANTRANLKVSVAFAGVAAIGGLMLFTQFMTVGLLLMGTSGGALAGYLTRARQDQKRLEQANVAPKNINPPIEEKG